MFNIPAPNLCFAQNSLAVSHAVNFPWLKQTLDFENSRKLFSGHLGHSPGCGWRDKFYCGAIKNSEWVAPGLWESIRYSPTSLAANQSISLAWQQPLCIGSLRVLQLHFPSFFKRKNPFVSLPARQQCRQSVWRCFPPRLFRIGSLQLRYSSKNSLTRFRLQMRAGFW